MAEHPIIFDRESIRGILAGRKTQTRRVMKPQPHHEQGDMGLFGWSWRWREEGFFFNDEPLSLAFATEFCPYGSIGDQLWVREAFVPNYFDAWRPAFRADWSEAAAELVIEPKWKSPLHMPRKLSRITLEIDGIGVEQLQSITNDDCIAEGATFDGENFVECADWFRDRWDAINGKRDDGAYAWEKNPWVWWIEFRVAPAGQAVGNG